MAKNVNKRAIDRVSKRGITFKGCIAKTYKEAIGKYNKFFNI